MSLKHVPREIMANFLSPARSGYSLAYCRFLACFFLHRDRAGEQKVIFAFNMSLHVAVECRQVPRKARIAVAGVIGGV